MPVATARIPATMPAIGAHKKVETTKIKLEPIDIMVISFQAGHFQRGL